MLSFNTDTRVRILLPSG